MTDDSRETHRSFEWERPAETSDPAQTQTVPAPSWDPRLGEWVEPGMPVRQPAAGPGRSAWLRASIAGGVVGALIATAIAVPIARSNRGGGTVVERRLAEGVTPSRQGGASIIDIAAKARPWVVNVNVTEQQASPLGGSLRGTGSGVILRSDGHILTNAHVVQGAETIEVTLASGQKLEADVVGADADTDVAVIKVAGDDLPAAVMGSAKDLRVGEVAVAIGSPLGLEQTVTAGIISAVGRTVALPGQPPLVDMIQTDAPITQGNSGGALVNGDGAVIGINALIAASAEVGAEGIAFAIPIDVAVAVAQELISTGRATHPWLGVSGGNITPETAEEFGVEQGAFVVEVVAGGPADKAGFRPDDVVVSFEGERIDSMDELIVAIRNRKVGDTVSLVVVRGGERITLRAMLADKPDNI